jgi:hypothetical protein
MRTKDGIAMVISPLSDTHMRLVIPVSLSPADRTFPIGDDH